MRIWWKKSPRRVKAWVAIGGHALGGLFAFGEVAVAPFAVGFWSISLLPLGALAMGVFPIGGVSVGIWSVGLLAVGWQAVGECAFAWNAVCGDIQYAVDGFWYNNDESSWQFIQTHRFLRAAMLFGRYWLWTNLLWVIPLWLIQRWVSVQARRRREQENA